MLSKVCIYVIRFVPTPPSPSVRRHVPLPLQHHRSLSESNGELPSSRFAPFRVADPPPMSPRYQATPPDWERSRLYRYFSANKLYNYMFLKFINYTQISVQAWLSRQTIKQPWQGQDITFWNLGPMELFKLISTSIQLENHFSFDSRRVTIFVSLELFKIYRFFKLLNSRPT